MFLSVLGFLCFAGILVYTVAAKVGAISKPNKLLTALWIPITLISLVLMMNPFYVVPTGSRGLIFTWGKINNRVIQPGLTVRMPIMQDIRKINIKPIQYDVTIVVGPDGAITADNQTVGATITVLYKYKESELVDMWSNVGEDKIKNVISLTTIAAFKAIIGQHNIFDIPLNQDSIREKAFTDIKFGLSKYPVELTEVKVTNYDWSDAFDKQIEETMHRAQQVKQKEQELLMTEQEANKKVKEAEADKNALIAQAEGEKAAAILRADAKAAEGEGIKKYNQSVQANMDLEVRLRSLEIEKIKAEKWDGAYVPVNNYTPIPISNSAGLLPKQ